ncbi:Nrap protein [Dipodascopsis tothii]|uniref:Nrap protein n=1 Tax=Dipodascopsis tothii TaxID=44089 RepID=UPI0034CFDA75
MYKSSIFKMEIEELLAETRLKYDKMRGVEKILHQLKAAIEKIEAVPEASIADAQRLLQAHKVAVPFPDPLPSDSAAYRLAYAPPSDFNVVGAYALKTVIRHPKPFAIDVAVTMPKSLFQDKDVLNYRYFYKRAYYVATIAAGLQAQRASFPVKVSYELVDGDYYRPAIRLDSVEGPLDFARAKCYVRIVPVVAEDTFAPARLALAKNCVRYRRLEADADALRPTPFYNSAIAADAALVPLTTFLFRAAQACDGLRDACVLGEVWLKQRGFSSTIADGGFGGFEWAVLMAALLHGGGARGTKVLASGFSSYQLFKATLQFLATTDLAAAPLTVLGAPAAVPAELADQPVLVHAGAHANVLWKVAPWAYAALRHEAALALEQLDRAKDDHFDAMFLTRVARPVYQFDAVATLRFARASEDATYVDAERVAAPSFYQYASTRVWRVLRRGLGARVAALGVRYSENTGFALSRRKAAPDASALTVGVVLAADCHDTVTRGPPADDKAGAAAFRAFWGAKAELRRFKDGAITEAVVWKPRPGQTVVAAIVEYLVATHFGPKVAATLAFAAPEDIHAAVPHADADPAPLGRFQRQLAAFTALQKQLVELAAVPLQITAVLPAAPSLRYAAVRTPRPFVIARADDYADIVLQFESSARWPDDLVALQHTKIALLAQIGAALADADGTATTRLDVDPDAPAVANPVALEILTGAGFAFRARVAVDKEGLLLAGRPRDADLRARFLRQTALEPRHTTELQTLCYRYPALSATVRGLKLWFNAHYLAPLFDDAVVELLAVHAFLRPYPWAVPASSTAGVVRTLRFLAGWDWRADPLVLDTDGQMTIAERRAIDANFKKLRAADPAMGRAALFVATRYEPSGVAWTAATPTLAAARMTALARACTAVLDGDVADVALARLFVSPVKDFDIRIRLTKAARPRLPPGVPSSYPTAEDSVDCGTMFFDDLRRIYANTLVFFRDNTRPDLIYGLWDPALSQPRRWKALAGYSTAPATFAPVTASEAEQVVLNKDAVMVEIARIGADLVEAVENVC